MTTANQYDQVRKASIAEGEAKDRHGFCARADQEMTIAKNLLHIQFISH